METGKTLAAEEDKSHQWGVTTVGNDSIGSVSEDSKPARNLEQAAMNLAMFSDVALQQQLVAEAPASDDLSLFVQAIEAMTRYSSPAQEDSSSYQVAIQGKKRKSSGQAPSNASPNLPKRLHSLEPVDLLETDVVAGPRSQHAGNQRYRELILEYAAQVGDLDMSILVKKVMEDIAPGRFVRSDGPQYFLLAQNQVWKKVNNALRDAAGLNKKQTTTQLLDLKESDVIAGNRPQHPGNQRYRELVVENAVHVGDLEMSTLIKKVMEDIAPGRFVRAEGKQVCLLEQGQIWRKINNALRDAAGLNKKPNSDNPKRRGAKPVIAKAKEARTPLAAISNQVVLETRSTDVLGGSSVGEDNPGNVLFRALVLKYLAEFDSKNQDVIVDRIMVAVRDQEPPGRFLSPNNHFVLGSQETKAKVWVALNHEYQLMLERECSETMLSTGKTDSRQKPTDVETSPGDVVQGRHQFQARTTDILGGLGKLKPNPGNVLFRDLVARHVDDFESNSTAAITLIMDTIRDQDPSGRFLSSDNQSVLSKSQARNKVRLALHNKFSKKTSQSKHNPFNQEGRSSSEPVDRKLQVEISSPSGAQGWQVAIDESLKPRTTDVLGEWGKGQQDNPGNLVFQELVLKHVVDFYSGSQDVIIKEIVDAVYNQEPAGRFLSPNNKSVLTKAKTHAKVWVALNREHQLLQENASVSESSGGEHVSSSKDEGPVAVVSSGSEEEGTSDVSPSSAGRSAGGKKFDDAQAAKGFLNSMMKWCLPSQSRKIAENVDTKTRG